MVEPLTSKTEQLLGKVQAELLKLLPKDMADKGMVYAPALLQMTVDELIALWDMIAARDYRGAQDVLHGKMTQQELAKERQNIAVLAKRLVGAQGQFKQFLEDLLLSILKGVILAATAALTF